MYATDDRDFYRDTYHSGGLHIGKKWAFEKISGFDENIFWQEGEDVLISKKISGSGLYSRTIPQARALSRSYFKFTPTPFGLLDYPGIECEYRPDSLSPKIRWYPRNIAKFVLFTLIEKSWTNPFLNAAFSTAKWLKKKFS